MLGQVILNMVINGVEAMPEGGSLSLTTDSSDNGCVEIRVSDSGVGIPKEELPRIFEPFYSTKPEGTGLGLSISQSIVKQHYGEIQVESEMGEGTSFIVRLPVYQDNAGT
jgi:signal transduction histidine kinase